jgi:hypothetical protein
LSIEIQTNSLMKEKNDTEKTPFCFVSKLTLGSAVVMAAASFSVVFLGTKQMNNQLMVSKAKVGSVSLLKRSANISDLSLSASSQGNWVWSFEALPELQLVEDEEYGSDPIPVAFGEGAESEEVGNGVQTLLSVEAYPFESIARPPAKEAATSKPASPVKTPKPAPPKPEPAVPMLPVVKSLPVEVKSEIRSAPPVEIPNQNNSPESTK